MNQSYSYTTKVNHENLWRFSLMSHARNSGVPVSLHLK